MPIDPTAETPNRKYRAKLYRGVWCAVYSDNGATKRVSLRTTDREEALRLIADLERGGATPVQSNDGILGAYIADKKLQGKRSIDQMEAARKALKETFGALRPDQITRELCREHTKRRRAAGISDGTIIREIGVMKAAVVWAGVSLPKKTFEVPSEPPPRDRSLSREEYVKCLAACMALHIKAVFVLLLQFACRIGALLGLTWDRVDFARRLVVLSDGQANRKGRAVIPMSDTAYEMLQELYAVRTCEYVIEYGSKPVKSVKKAFREVVARAGLVGVTPHVLRHTAAVWMAQAGVDLLKIAKYLGHSNPKTTFKVYAKFAPDFMKDAAEALTL